jgi:hypothetical protein
MVSISASAAGGLEAVTLIQNQLPQAYMYFLKSVYKTFYTLPLLSKVSDGARY